MNRRGAIGAGVGVVGMGLARAVADTEGDRERGSLRIGTVVAYDAGSITVRVANGEQTNFPYLRSYEPTLGESVVLQQYGSTWLAIGTPSGMPPETGNTPGVDHNPVVNPSFELDPDGATTITGWGVVQSGPFSPTVIVQDMFTSLVLDGRRMVEVRNTSSAFAGVTDIYSSPIPVVADQLWSASAWFTAITIPAAESAELTLKLAWFANATDVYPTTVATDTQLANHSTPLGYMQTWVPLRDGFAASGAAVPAGATHMRVVIEVITRGATTHVYLDRVVARRVV